MRFPGFEGEYKLYVFEDIFLFSTGKNIKQNEASPDFEIPCVRYGELYHMYNEVINEVINKTNLDKSDLTFSKGDEILLPSAGEDPLDIGSASALTIEGVAIGRTINILRPLSKNVYSPTYTSYYINQKLKKKISTLAKGVSISNVYNSDLKTLEIVLPSFSEQVKIANFLCLIDARMQTQNKIIKELGVSKTTFAKRIFSQELRFKDDKGNEFPEWETKKLKEVCKIYDGTHQTPNYIDYGIPFYSVEHLTANQFDNTKYISEEVYEKENKRVKIEKGDILMTRIGSIGVAKYINWTANASFYVSLALIKQSNRINNEYLCHFINSSFFQSELWKRTIHVAFPKKINLGEIGECLIKVPKPTEQIKIANFLSSIDSKIEIETQLLQKLEEQKKFLLQKMFI